MSQQDVLSLKRYQKPDENSRAVLPAGSSSSSLWHRLPLRNLSNCQQLPSTSTGTSTKPATTITSRLFGHLPGFPAFPSKARYLPLGETHLSSSLLDCSNNCSAKRCLCRQGKQEGYPLLLQQKHSSMSARSARNEPPQPMRHWQRAGCHSSASFRASHARPFGFSGAGQ